MQVFPVPIPFPVPTSPPSGIPEWVKILVTALSSLAVGILLEPLRAAIQHWIAKSRTCTIVAKEINVLALQMTSFLNLRQANHSPTNRLTQKPQFDTERYDHAYANNRDHLYEIPSWDSLKRFYDAVKKATTAEVLTDDEVSRLLIEFELLEDRINDGILGAQMKTVLIKNKLSFLTKLTAQYRK